jgi:hypothetical protein
MTDKPTDGGPVVEAARAMYERQTSVLLDARAALKASGCEATIDKLVTAIEQLLKHDGHFSEINRANAIREAKALLKTIQENQNHD